MGFFIELILQHPLASVGKGFHFICVVLQNKNLMGLRSPPKEMEPMKSASAPKNSWSGCFCRSKYVEPAQSGLGTLNPHKKALRVPWHAPNPVRGRGQKRLASSWLLLKARPNSAASTNMKPFHGLWITPGRAPALSEAPQIRSLPQGPALTVAQHRHLPPALPDLLHGLPARKRKRKRRPNGVPHLHGVRWLEHLVTWPLSANALKSALCPGCFSTMRSPDMPSFLLAALLNPRSN